MGGLVSGWPLIPLGRVLRERRETPGPSALVTGQIRIVSKIRFDTGALVFRDGGETKTKMILIQPGDLVLSGINAVKGAVARYANAEVGPVAATIHFGAYEVDTDLAEPDYLWWLLRSRWFRESLASSLPNGVKTEVKARRLLPFCVPLPSLKEQQVAVVHLRAAEDQFRKSQTLMATTTALTSTLLEAHLREFLEVLPCRGTFDDIVVFRPRSGPSFVTSPEASGHPVLMPSATSGFGVNPLKVEYAVEAVTPPAKDILREGDIIIARGNKVEQVGNAGVVPAQCEGWVCANLLMRMQVDRDLVDPAFLVYWLRTPRMRRLVKQQMSGTSPSIQKINQRKILAFPFPVGVPLARQREMTRRLACAEAQAKGLGDRRVILAREIEALAASSTHQLLGLTPFGGRTASQLSE